MISPSLLLFLNVLSDQLSTAVVYMEIWCARWNVLGDYGNSNKSVQIQPYTDALTSIRLPESKVRPQW